MNAILRWMLSSWASAQNVVLGKVDAAVPAVPDAVSEACANAKAAMSWIGPVSYLVPWSWVGVAFGVVVVGITAAIVIKIIRIVASYATAGGGSAG